MFGYLDLDLDFKSIDLKCLDSKSIDFKIFCLDDLKSLRFEFRLNPSRILKAQIHGFQMTS